MIVSSWIVYSLLQRIFGNLEFCIPHSLLCCKMGGCICKENKEPGNNSQAQQSVENHQPTNNGNNGHTAETTQIIVQHVESQPNHLTSTLQSGNRTRVPSGTSTASNSSRHDGHGDRGSTKVRNGQTQGGARSDHRY